MHANAATALEEYVKPGAKVLDVGCGSGYLTAVMIFMKKCFWDSGDDRFSRGWFSLGERLLGSNICLN